MNTKVPETLVLKHYNIVKMYHFIHLALSKIENLPSTDKYVVFDDHKRSLWAQSVQEAICLQRTCHSKD